jgi:tRNA nucleotidyltransferase (CCA-adding enzyme)
MATVTTLAGNEFAPELPGRLLHIVRDIREAGGRAFLVGGWVRDALLGKNCRDYDIEVYDIGQEELVPILKKYGKTNLVGKAFGVIHLAMKGESLDFSFPRTESKVGYGHRGFVVHTDEKLSFKEAALRRDFTINAMGMELPDLTLCDPYGGIDDLKTHVLRHVGPAFAEDSLRILRGVQFASRFECTLAPETVELCRTLSLADLSVERLFEEFKKWLLKPGRPSMGLKAFLNIGLEGFFPEVVPLAGSWEALGSLLDSMSESRAEVLRGNPSALSDEECSELAFAALLSGNALARGAGDVKGVAGKFLTRITNELHLLKKVPEILACYAGLDFEKVPSAPELRRLSVRLGGLKLLCLLVQATPVSAAGKPVFAAALRDAAREIGVYDAAPQPYLTGKMLLDMGMKPGKQMGDIIKRSFELQLDGEIKNISDALAWAKEINLSLSV